MDALASRTPIQLSIAVALAAMALLAGCATTTTTSPPAPEVPEPPPLYEFHPEGLSGPLSLVINLREQKARIYIGGQYAGWTTVATGREGYSTPGGHYTILEKVVNKHSTLYGKMVDSQGNTTRADADARKHSPPPGGRFVPAPMPYWMRLTWRGVGMHAGPIPRPGHPASHGCIRLPREMAIDLYHRVRIGTPVRIVR